MKINTIPPKRLAETITGASTTFQLTDIEGFDGVNLSSSIVGDTLYASFQDTSGTILELMRLDPTTIAAGSITILKRGLQFNEDGTETEVAGNKLLWIKNQTIVNLGTNTPAIMHRFVKDVDPQTIGGIKTFTSIPVLPASDPVSDNQAARKAYVDSAAIPIGYLDTDGALTANSDVKVPSQKAVKTYAMPISYLDTDVNLAANSDVKVPSQKAIKAYADALAIAGAPDASTTAKGIVEEATQAEVDAGTAVGGTGARLFVNPSTILAPILGGDGSDGPLSINAGTTTLTKDTYYTTVAISGTAILQTAGYRLFASVSITVDASSGACIKNNGGAGGAGVPGNPSTVGTAGAVATGNTLPAGSVGKIGGAGGAVGVAGDAVTVSAGVSGAAGGDGGRSPGGGTGGGDAGGAAGAATSSPVRPRSLFNGANPFTWTSSTAVSRVLGSAGSGSGAGGVQNPNGAGAGGGSGASGGWVYLETKLLSLTGAGCVQSHGGNGGAGADTISGSGGGGGGAGGSGGVIVAVYLRKTGAGTMTATGGTGGAGGAGGGGTGGAGVAGSNGNAGVVYEITR